jgi:hypothetical protein
LRAHFRLQLLNALIQLFVLLQQRWTGTSCIISNASCNLGKPKTSHAADVFEGKNINSKVNSNRIKSLHHIGVAANRFPRNTQHCGMSWMFFQGNQQSPHLEGFEFSRALKTVDQHSSTDDSDGQHDHPYR